MARTTRWYYRLNMVRNPYWYRHELKYVRIKLHRRYRHRNRITLRKGVDIESEPRTTGWETY